MEIYAAFQPFNESTRAIGPALAAFTAGLRPGDYVLDPWCRSGWSAEWLAGLCPDQTVIALWEGDRSVLGYRGFAHWLPTARRSPNLEIMFVHPERGLPFADDQFGALYALDAFHRFSPQPFAGECLRVARPYAAIALAHLHLSNSEPEPYFDRGGKHWRGRDYDAWVSRLAETSGREGRVFSEADLFAAEGQGLPRPDPDTAHYNGFVLLTPKGEHPAQGPHAPRDEDVRLLVNPLFALHFQRGGARIQGALHDGAVGELLARHPIYQARLPQGLVELDDLDFAILALAVTGRSLAEVAGTLALTPQALDQRLASLEATELVRRAEVGAAAIDLQRFHANQMPPHDPGGALAALVAGLANGEHVAVRAGDGAEATAGELHDAIGALALGLRQRGLKPGNRLHIGDLSHPLAIAVLLAGLSEGLDVGADAIAPAEIGMSIGPPQPAIPDVKRLPFEPDDQGSACILDWLSAPQQSPLSPGAAGRIRLAVDGRMADFPADQLCQAAQSLASAASSLWEPIMNPFRLPIVLACLQALDGKSPIVIAG
jgi:hypothetical protein